MISSSSTTSQQQRAKMVTTIASSLLILFLILVVVAIVFVEAVGDRSRTTTTLSLTPSPTESSSSSPSMSSSPSRSSSPSMSSSSSHSMSSSPSMSSSSSSSMSSSSSDESPSRATPTNSYSETATLTSTMSISTTRSVSSTVTLYSLSATISTSKTASESISESKSSSASSTASLSTSDSRSVSVSNSVSQSSSVSTSDSRTETMTLTPPPTPTQTFSKTLSKTMSLSISDNSPSTTKSSTESKSSSLSDTSSLTFTASQTVSESASLSYSDTLTPPPTPTRTFSRTLSKTKTLSDTDSLSETFSPSRTYSTSLTFSGSLSTSETSSLSFSASKTDSALSYSGTVTSDGTVSQDGTYSKSWFTYTESPTFSESHSHTESHSLTNPTDSLSFSENLTVSRNTRSLSGRSDTLSGSPDVSMTLNTDTFSRNLTKSIFTYSESGSAELTVSNNTDSLSFSDSLTRTSSPSVTESPSLTFSASHSISFSIEPTESHTLSFTDSLSFSSSPSPTESHSLTESLLTHSSTDTLQLTTSAIPPTTTPVPTPTRTLMTECPPNCGQGVCSNTYPYFCICHNTERLGFWAKEKALEGTCDRCKPGYYGPDCNIQCPGGTCAICGGHGNCDEGVSGSGICTCFNNTVNGFWTGTSCSTCVRGFWGEKCTDRCLCVRGTCDDGRYGSGRCDCTGTGYKPPLCAECDPATNAFCQQTLNCPNKCSGHGKCLDDGNGNGICDCEPLYGSIDCSNRCPEDPSNGDLCYGHGTCDAGRTNTGLCICYNATWMPQNCSQCIHGYWGEFCHNPCFPNSSMPCYNHGTCDWKSGQCQCDPGYGGTGCSVACPTSVPGKVCSNHGICNSVGLCQCDSDAQKGYWDGVACDRCNDRYWGSKCLNACGKWPPTNGAVCNGQGSCNSTNGQCSCINNHCGELCEVVRDPDGVCRSCPQPTQYGPACDQTCLCENGRCSNGKAGDGSCTCNYGWAGPYCNLTCIGGATTVCSGHGDCNPQSVQCECFPGYSGIDCSNSCIILDCSGHGDCSDGILGTGNCTCQDGWVFNETGCKDECLCINGGYCEFPSLNCTCVGNFTGDRCQNCIPGLAGAKCDQQCGGITNGTECVCRDGFGGPTCDDPCPVSDLGICSGPTHGRCSAVTAECECNPFHYGPSCRCTDAYCQASNIRTVCNNETGACQCTDEYDQSDPSCDTCRAGLWGVSCDQDCNCNKKGRCDKPSGIQCTCYEDPVNGYWAGSTCDVCLSGFMGSGCLQRSVSVTTLSPLFQNIPGAIQNYWSSFDDATRLYYTGGANSRAFVFNLTSNLPVLESVATNNFRCDKTLHPNEYWNAGVPRFMWPHPNDKNRWMYVIEGNASCDQVARLQAGPKNNTVYAPPRTTQIGSVTPDFIRFAIFIKEYMTFCYIPDRRSNADSWQIGCHPLNNNVTNLVPRTTNFDPVSGMLWIPNRQRVLLFGGVDSSCGFQLAEINNLAVDDWEGKIQNQMTGQTPRTACRVIDVATYASELNTVLFGAMAVEGVFLSGVDFNTGKVLQVEIISPLQQLRSTAIIFHSKTKVGLASFANTLIKFRTLYPNGDTSQTVIVQPYGQQQIGNSLVTLRGFDLFEEQRMVLAPRRSYGGVQILRFLLVEVTDVHPPLADSRGGTRVLVTGNNFAPTAATNPVCRFGSYDPVPATIHNETAITCVVPASESAEECEINYVEVSLNNFSFTANQVELDRPNEPIVVSASPSRVKLGSSNNVTITGRGFKAQSRGVNVLVCRFFYSQEAMNNQSTTTDFLVVPGTFVSPTTVICHLGQSDIITSAGSGVQVSLDGQRFSTSAAPFSVIGPGSGITCKTPNAAPQGAEYDVELTNGSLPVTTFSAPITVNVVDVKNNRVGELDPVNRTAQAQIPFALLSKFSPQNPVWQMTSGTVNITGMSMTLPPVGTTAAAIRVGAWDCVFAFRISAGRLAALRIKIQPLTNADLLQPDSLLPQTTEVELVDDGENLIAGLENIELNVSLIEVTRPANRNTSSASSTVENPENITLINVTRNLNRIISRDTGVAAFPPIPLPIVFGSFYQLRFEVIVDPTINITTVAFTPSCPRNQFQIYGESQCRECPHQQATCNGTNILLAKPGYWRTDPNSLEFYRCPVESACLAASEFSGCAEGYGGLLCNDCAEGYGKDFSGKCQTCGNVVGDIIVLLMAIVGVFSFFGVLTLLYIQNCTFDNTATGQIATTLQLAMTMYQTLSLLSFIDIAWPSVVFQLLAGLETFLDFRIFNFLSSDCFFRRIHIDTSAIFLFYGVMICFAIGIPMTIRPLVRRWPNVFMTEDAVKAREDWLASPLAKVQYATIEKFGKDADPMNYLKQHQPKAILLNALQVVFFFGIQPALRSAFEVLPCVQIIGDNGFAREVMLNDVRVSCESAGYLTFKVIAICLVVLYALVVPFIYALGAAYYRFRYFDTYYKSYMGFSACGMTDDLWYWIPTILLRKIWLVIIVSFLEAPINLYFFVWSMMGFAWFAYSRRPYKNDRHIFIENVCNLNVIITGNIAMTMYVLDSPEGVTVLVLQAFALLVNGVVAGLLLYELLKQVILKTICARKKNKRMEDIQKSGNAEFDEDEFERELEEQFNKHDSKTRQRRKSRDQNSNNNGDHDEYEDEGEVYDFGKGHYDVDPSGGTSGAFDPDKNHDDDDDDEDHDDNDEEDYEDDDEGEENRDPFDIVSGTHRSGSATSSSSKKKSRRRSSSVAAAEGAKTVSFFPGKKASNKNNKNNNNSNKNKKTDKSTDFIDEFAKSNNSNNNRKDSQTEKSSKSDKNSHATARMAYKSWYEPPTALRDKPDGALGALDDWFGGASEFDQQQNDSNMDTTIRAVNSIALDASAAYALDDIEMLDQTMRSNSGGGGSYVSRAEIDAAESSLARTASLSSVNLRNLNNSNNNNNNGDDQQQQQPLHENSDIISDEELMHALNDVGTTIQQERAKMKAMLDMKSGGGGASKQSSDNQQKKPNSNNSTKKNNMGLTDEEYQQEMNEIYLAKRRVQDLHNQHVSPLEAVREFASSSSKNQQQHQENENENDDDQQQQEQRNASNSNNSNNKKKGWLNVERFDDEGNTEEVTTENSISSGRRLNNERNSPSQGDDPNSHQFYSSSPSFTAGGTSGNVFINDENDHDNDEKKKKKKNGDGYSLGGIDASAFDW